MNYKKAFLIAGSCLIIASAGFIFNIYIASKTRSQNSKEINEATTTSSISPGIGSSSPATMGSTLSINNHVYSLEVARTLAEQEQGLSDTTSLPENTLMLFDFDHNDFWGIWMKDMKYSLDIFWLDADYKVITIKSNADPSTYPIIFNPARPAKYVIEAPADFAAEEKISVGAVLDIKE